MCHVWLAERFQTGASAREDLEPVIGKQIARRPTGLLSAPLLAARSGLQGLLVPEPWRPYRTIAMWYLWQQIDGPRDAKTKAQAEVIAEEESERQIIAAD